MRLLGRLLLLIAFAALVFSGGPYEWPKWGKASTSDWENGFSAYPVFWLDSQQALNFEIPANAVQVRVQLTPVVAGGQGNTPLGDEQVEEPQTYQVVYRTLDSGQQVLSQTNRRFAYSSGVDHVNRGTRFFDQPEGEQAGLSQGLFIEASDLLSELQIQLQKDGSDKVRVAVRVSILERKKETELRVLWQRMHRDQRAALMAENIYPADLVSDQERRNALKFSWLPIGPTGRTYQTATLFIGNDSPPKGSNEDVEPPRPSSHMLADEAQVFTLIPSTIGANTLRCEALADSQQALNWLELLIQDPLTGGKPLRQMVTGDELNDSVALLQPDALYQVRASNRCQIRLFDVQGNSVISEVNGIRAYISQGEQPLTYALSLNGNALQPIRLDVRGLQSAGSPVSQQAVNWRVMDHQGTNLLSGSFTTLTDKDMYESLPPNSANSQYDEITSKISRFIIAPAEATTLVVEASSPVLVTVFTRPLTLSYVADESLDLPKWFMALPADHQGLQQKGDSQVYYWQQRLRDIEQASPAGLALSQWSALETLENLATSELFGELLPMESAANLNHYHPLTAKGWSGVLGAEATDTDQLQQGISPSLVYIRALGASEPEKVSVSIDAQPMAEYWLVSPSGRLSLPIMDPGPRRIVIDGPSGVKWYINQVPDGEPGYRIRNAYSLISPLTFMVDKKAGQEWVSFHYFPASQAAHNIEVKLMVTQESGEFSAHTIPLRRYSIPAQSSGHSDGVHLLNQVGKKVGVPQVLLFPLDEDLSNGQYQLKVGSTTNSGFIQGSYVFTNNGGTVELFQQTQNLD